jgi:hypothetical protein
MALFPPAVISIPAIFLSCVAGVKLGYADLVLTRDKSIALLCIEGFHDTARHRIRISQPSDRQA